MKSFIRSEVEPTSLSWKVISAERSSLYLAMLQRWFGDERAAKKTLQPMMLQCCNMLRETVRRYPFPLYA
jgi:hypothetical protein